MIDHVGKYDEFDCCVNLLYVTHPRVMMKAFVAARIFEVSLGKHRRKACHQRIDPII